MGGVEKRKRRSRDKLESCSCFLEVLIVVVGEWRHADYVLTCLLSLPLMLNFYIWALPQCMYYNIVKEIAGWE